MDPARPLRIGIWCAVSSRPQAAPDKTSLEDQEQQGRDFAQALGGEIVAVYRIPGHSRDIWNWHEAESQMDAYRQLRADVEDGRLDVLHALDPDRLGRDPALAQQVLSLVEKSGAEVYLASAPHQIGQKSVSHRYISAIQSVRAGEDQALRVHRHRSGMRGRIRRGLHPGRWPYGYTPIRDATGRVTGAEIDPEPALAIRFMVDLFLRGESYNNIRLALRDSHHQPPAGVRWSFDTVRRILNNDTYAGLVGWGPFRTEDPSAHFPAIWNEDTHAAIVRERQRRRRVYHHPKGGPLTGVAYCLRCGSTMGRMAKRDRPHVYLRCNRHTHRARLAGTCHPNYIREDLVLRAVGQFLASLATPQARQAAVRAAQPDQDLDGELDAITARIATFDEQRTRLALAYAAGQMRADVYRAADDQILARLESAQARAADIRAILAARPDVDERLAILDELLDQLPALQAGEVPPWISTLLQNAGIRAYIEDGEVITVTLAI